MCGAAAQAGEYTGSYSSRSLMPNGTHGFPKVGEVVNSGGSNGKDFVFTGSGWELKV